ncbi:hypothetical protein GCM10011579_098060 [Streptomyces albiflavescens]|uniref:Winged helix-turn helix domain-containing protein n=1 Tax=Streptomyces albiflavescens TaxID=1623582 RepID=A0A918DAR8_9ACTN|nr:winged helix-turn-helix domain-containing protein [Streptomyces albiflavescens]GGN96513.1 hypothetical protein GCM10011579_098060 [Streptomyces albiflavescens]
MKPSVPAAEQRTFLKLTYKARPAEHGWEDQRWTLAWIRVLMAWRFRLDRSSAAVWRLIHRHGWSWQCPARRALERDEGAVGLWKMDVWPQAE